jgi:hypothetical protein
MGSSDRVSARNGQAGNEPEPMAESTGREILSDEMPPA